MSYDKRMQQIIRKKNTRMGEKSDPRGIVQ